MYAKPFTFGLNFSYRSITSSYLLHSQEQMPAGGGEALLCPPLAVPLVLVVLWEPASLGKLRGSLAQRTCFSC